MTFEVTEPSIGDSVAEPARRRGQPGQLFRHVRTAVVATGVLAILGVPAGLLWSAVSPRAVYVVREKESILLEPDTQAIITADGRFAIITAVAGLVTGLAAYLLAGRLHGVPLLLGVAAGGTAAALLAWWTGHRIGLSTYENNLATKPDGTLIDGVIDLNAAGLVVVWPLLAVVTYGVFEAFDVARRDARWRASTPLPAPPAAPPPPEQR